MSTLIAEFGGYILTALGLIVSAVVLYFTGKKSGESKEKTKQAEQTAVKEVEAARDAAKVQIETSKGAANVRNEVNKLNDGSAADELREQWSRDKK